MWVNLVIFLYVLYLIYYDVLYYNITILVVVTVCFLKQGFAMYVVPDGLEFIV